ncbi:MAG TPA: hypothetical protein VGQ44_13600 [Gemmatimonadaceae bacterium]|jgi:hypothetical protein|nr:hypothetical protein [Gemmatimonadaceae bacterium]
MRKSSRTAPFIVLSAVFFVVACGGSNDATTPTGPVTQPSSVASAITAGTWAVGTLTQNTEDKANQFSGYTFTFSRTGDAEAGSVTATKGGNTITGTWSHAAAVTYYGSTSTESMVLSLGASSPFAMLTKTWNVVSNTTSTLTLVSPEVAENMHLVFIKQ